MMRLLTLTLDFYLILSIGIAQSNIKSCTPGPSRVDVHTHAIPPKYRSRLVETGHTEPDGVASIPAWTAEDHLSLMNTINVTRSVLSISSPGTFLIPNNTTYARTVTREANIELSNITKTYPHRFSFFASLPLPDVEGSLQEIDYALDVLGAVGFTVLTNTQGVYLGNSTLEPVFKKLNERNATIFIHPTTCSIFGSSHQTQELIPVVPQPSYPRPIMEFMFDTARTVVDLLLSNTVVNNPSLTFVVAHCGAVLPPILERVAVSSLALSLGHQTPSLDDMKDLLRTRFYFDMAGWPFPDQIHGLLRLTHLDRLLYGSDYPFTPGFIIPALAETMSSGLCEDFGFSSSLAVSSGNAAKLLLWTPLG